MANTTSQKTRKTTTRKTTSTPIEATQTEALVVGGATTKEYVAKDIDQNQYITVRNGFQGQLVYKSRKTGEVYIWDKFGDEQEMELLELKNAKNSYKSFFTNNWFMFDESWVIDYLGVRQFYKNAISIDGFDDIFKMSPAELKETIAALSDGQKKSVAYRAKELITSKEIDSLSVIDALEEVLNIELIER